jgi:putative chitinase
MGMIPKELIDKLWPHGDSVVPGLRQAIADGDEWLVKAGIITPLQVAHFMAQVSHECGAGTELIENLNYRAEQLTKQWPSHFTSAQAAAMAHNQKAIANQAYNGRMGNRIGTDDGWNFRGRGGVQTTGRDAYEKLSKTTGLDLITHPEWIIDPRYFMQVCTMDFVQCGCLPYASTPPDGDILNVTKRLNGGTIGLDMRKQWFAKWKAALAGSHVDPHATPAPTVKQEPVPYLRVGGAIPGAEGPTSVGGANGPTPLV